ncbi:MAG: biotin/lipoyl-binding protein [Acidobacteriota bacterium]|nr:biotin/lipoyl-binding protein [Acidobacteriota bacterium]MDH3521970.1 biotin/lipoyl-binding protein [Acidobacteriota bacterium]
MELIVKHADGDTKVKIDRRGAEYQLQIGDQSYVILSAEAANGVRSLLVDGGQYEVSVRSLGEDRYEVTTTAGAATVQVQDPLTQLAEVAHEKQGGTGRQRVAAYMPGRVVSVLVAEGEAVTAGQGLLVLEAMKMENEIQAEQAGVIAKLHVTPGQAVDRGDPLFELEPAGQPDRGAGGQV